MREILREAAPFFLLVLLFEPHTIFFISGMVRLGRDVIAQFSRGGEIGYQALKSARPYLLVNFHLFCKVMHLLSTLKWMMRPVGWGYDRDQIEGPFEAYENLKRVKWAGKLVDVYANNIKRLVGLAAYLGRGQD